jgi:hypothetical protein
MNANPTISPTFVVIRGFLFFAYLALHPLIDYDMKPIRKRVSTSSKLEDKPRKKKPEKLGSITLR